MGDSLSKLAATAGASPAGTGASSRSVPGPAHQTADPWLPPWDKGKREQVPLDMAPLGEDRRVSFGRGCKLEDEELALTGPGGFSKWPSLPAPLSRLVGCDTCLWEALKT